MRALLGLQLVRLDIAPSALTPSTVRDADLIGRPRPPHPPRITCISSDLRGDYLYLKGVGPSEQDARICVSHDGGGLVARWMPVRMTQTQYSRIKVRCTRPVFAASL